MLYIVATPIGNLADISERAKACLESVDFILCEDTRHSQRLLDHYGIKKPCYSYFAHNEAKRSEQIVPQLLEGASAALISDAGTPSISDPGLRLVRACHDAGVRVVPIPGASAAVAAVSACGIAHEAFRFIAFYPRAPKERNALLEAQRHGADLLVGYESPQRIVSLLKDIVRVLGPTHEVCLARELTKKYEEIVTTSAETLYEQLKERTVKGEITLLIAPGTPREDLSHAIDADALIRRLRSKLSTRDVRDIVAETLGLRPKAVYQRILELDGGHG